MTRANKKQPKLSKKDADFYSKIASMAGKKLLKERGPEYFAWMASRSHPRSEYHGGRPKNNKEST